MSFWTETMNVIVLSDDFTESNVLLYCTRLRQYVW